MGNEPMELFDGLSNILSSCLVNYLQMNFWLNLFFFCFSFLNLCRGWQKIKIDSFKFTLIIMNSSNTPNCQPVTFFLRMFLLFCCGLIYARLLIVINAGSDTSNSQGTHQHWIARTIHPCWRSVTKHDSVQASRVHFITVATKRIANSNARSNCEGNFFFHLLITARLLNYLWVVKCRQTHLLFFG